MAAAGLAIRGDLSAADLRGLVPPAAPRARRLVPDEEPRPAEEVLAGLPWQRVAWRRGTKGTLAARFAAVRVRVGDGQGREPLGGAGGVARGRHAPR